MDPIVQLVGVKLSTVPTAKVGLELHQFGGELSAVSDIREFAKNASLTLVRLRSNMLMVRVGLTSLAFSCENRA